jgi:hypothetical protein
MGDDAGSPTNPPVEAPEAPAAGVKRPAADHAAGDDPLASGSDPKRASTSEPEAAPSAGSEETIQIKVVVGGAGTETVTRRLDSTVLDLKRAIESRTGELTSGVLFDVCLWNAAAPPPTLAPRRRRPRPAAPQASPPTRACGCCSRAS